MHSTNSFFQWKTESHRKKSPNLISLSLHSVVRGALFWPAFFYSNKPYTNWICKHRNPLRCYSPTIWMKSFTFWCRKFMACACVRAPNMFLCKAFDFNGFFYWHNHMRAHTHTSTVFGMKQKQIYSMHSHNKIIKSYLQCFQTIFFLLFSVCSFRFRPFAKLFSKHFFSPQKWVEFGGLRVRNFMQI